MDIEKLIEAVRLCGSTPKVDQCKRCAYWSGGDMSKCIPRMTTDAATALSTLQAENAQLRAELERVKLVRCKNCKMSRPGGLGYVWCGPTAMPLDGFCSNGQQKED